MTPDDKRQTCRCGHRYGAHALDHTREMEPITGGWKCLAYVDDPDRTSLVMCSCQRWTPREPR